MRRDYSKLSIVAVLFTLLYTAWLTAQETVAPRPGHVVFQTDFDTPQERAAWSKADFAQWETGYQNTESLCVTVSPDQSLSGSMIHLPLDLTRYRDHRLLFECMAKAEQVSKPSERYLGVKFMLHYASESTGLHWQNQNGVDGTFDWRKLRFVATIEPDASGGQIDLGLQGSSGKVWLDAIKVTVFKGPPPKRPKPPLNPGPVFKGHDLSRLRGVMSPNTFRDEDLRVLGVDWNANAIRWQITRNWGRTGTDRDLDEYDRWIDSELEDLDKALAAAHRYGLKVVVDMHSPPGGRYENRDLAIFHEPVYQDHYVALWQKIAERYRGQPAIWGYDLVNEPVQCDPSPSGVADYWGTQVRAAEAIRAIDPEVPIFIEAGEWDSASGFRTLEPVDVPRVIYQVHMYVPGEFTHQGVYDKPTGIAYPGVIGAKQWNKDALREVLAPVREFQRAYNVHIYVGEFSAIRWAPGAADYLSDCIDLFEEYDWDWTYHAYREWDGWSVEHGSDSHNHQPTEKATDRKRLLLGWFARNEKPRSVPAVDKAEAWQQASAVLSDDGEAVDEPCQSLRLEHASPALSIAEGICPNRVVADCNRLRHVPLRPVGGSLRPSSARRGPLAVQPDALGTVDDLGRQGSRHGQLRPDPFPAAVAEPAGRHREADPPGRLVQIPGNGQSGCYLLERRRIGGPRFLRRHPQAGDRSIYGSGRVPGGTGWLGRRYRKENSTSPGRVDGVSIQSRRASYRIPAEQAVCGEQVEDARVQRTTTTVAIVTVESREKPPFERRP
jgi:endoglucanase